MFACRFRAPRQSFPWRLETQLDKEVPAEERAMSEICVGLVLIGIAGVVAWNLTSGHTTFVVRLVNGIPVKKRGAVTPAFLTEIEKLAREHALQSGCVWGVLRSDGRVSLRFDRAFPPGSQQQLRNWWTCNGWNSGKTRR